MKALSQPLFASLRGYDRAQLGPDLFSGVLIALLSIPISMGYAQLAGLPPVYGLYGSLVPILLFAMLSTTREFIFGVDAAPAAMIGAVVTSLGIAPGGAEAMRIVPVLTLYVALWLAVFALVRADKAVDYISEPVMGGFISGVCCEIILMQVPKLLGSGTGTGELFELLGHIFDAAKVINWPTAALGFATLAILLIAPRKWPKVPWVLVMMVLGGLLGAFAPLADWGVALLAAVPRGLPKVVLPDLTTLPFTQALVATPRPSFWPRRCWPRPVPRRKTATASTAAARSRRMPWATLPPGSSAAASCRAACRARPSTNATAAGRSSCPSWRA